jgi:hypothetical protein
MDYDYTIACFIYFERSLSPILNGSEAKGVFEIYIKS